VPVADVEAVIPLRRVARRGTEVPEIPRCAARVVLVVSRNWVGDHLDAAPGRVVRAEERLFLAVLVLDVTENEDGGVPLPHDEIRRRRLHACGPVAPTFVERCVGGLARDVSGDRDANARDGIVGRGVGHIGPGLVVGPARYEP
jgi:hypothetical protein